jgi:16S rRNA (cytosine967-C5)-methyltransferase
VRGFRPSAVSASLESTGSGKARISKPFVPPREKAIRILTWVLSENRPLDESLGELARDESPAGRAWLLDICSGTLRWKGRIDLILDSLALKKKPSGWLRKALMVATAQILLQDRVAAAAVVSETVTLIKRKEGEAPAKFANALLRKVADGKAEWLAVSFPDGGTAAEKAAWASLPLWFWERLVADRGETWARQFASESLSRPATWLHARRSDWKPENAESGPVPRSWKLTETGSIVGREGFAEGEFIVQDISSQRLVEEVAQATGAGSGQRVLDLCAAPGGKAIALLWRGFSVLASDRGGERLALLEANRKRVGASLEVIPADKLEAMPKKAFDLVWVDAPCTGSGIIRRHPDIRWLKKSEDVKALAQIQTDLLTKGWEFVRPGGYFVYSVCSVFKNEAEAHLVELEKRGEVLKTWLLSPQETGGDGFWACLVRAHA